MRLRNVAALLALVVVTVLAVFAASPSDEDRVGLATDWPPLRITYDMILHPRPGSTLENRATTALTYYSADDWHDEVIEATFNAGEPGATREFRDGVFTQNLPAAGIPIVEEIQPGQRVIPQRWLHPGMYEHISGRGVRVHAQDGSHVTYEVLIPGPCEGIDSADLPAHSDDPGSDVAVETLTFRTDITRIPIPVEYSVRIGDVVVEQAVVLEIILVDPGDVGNSR